MTGMNQDHYDAVQALLELDDALLGRVVDTVKLDAEGRLVRENYAVLYGGSPAELGGDRLRKSQVVDDNAVFDFVVRSVGVDAAAARATSQHVIDQLAGSTLTIAGRYCRPIKHTGGDRARPENSVKPPLFYIDDEFELRSFFRRG
jgi:hypothetical protein